MAGERRQLHPSSSGDQGLTGTREQVHIRARGVHLAVGRDASLRRAEELPIAQLLPSAISRSGTT